MEITARVVRLLAVLCLVALIFGRQAANGQVPAPDSRFYSNVDYQFSVELPREFMACVSEHTNHGVEIILDRHARCNGPDEAIPRIGVFANYNVATEAAAPEKLIHYICNYRVSRRMVWLNRVTLGGRRAKGCRRYLDGQRITVLILTLRKTDGPVWTWIEVGAELETTAQRFDSDMRVFRRVLKTVWIHPDGPDG